MTNGSPTSEESPSSSLLHSQYRRDLILNVNGLGVNSNLNQDVNTLSPLRGDAGAIGLSDVDPQYFNANEASASNFQKISAIDGSIASPDILPPRAPSVGKLRKRFPGRDGYESDGTYLSEKQAKRKEASRDGVDAKQRKKKKFFTQVINKISNDPLTKGYDTDGGAVLSLPQTKKSQTKKSNIKDPSNEIGYETDGGYQSGNKKSKTGFFRLSKKSSKVDDLRVASEPVPALPNFAKKTNELVVPLPIAGRFAATLPSPTTESGESQRKPQKGEGLLSPLRSSHISMQGDQQQHGLRTASSLSSLQDPNSVISLPTSPTANLPLSSQSLSASPTVSLPTSFPSFQEKKTLRVQLHSKHPAQQNSPSQCVPESPDSILSPLTPLKNPSRPTKVRPRNPPTDGFGPRSSLRSDSSYVSTPGPNPILHCTPTRGVTPTFISSSSSGLSGKSCPQGSSKRSSQPAIIPSLDYIEPSTQISPLKTRFPAVSMSHHHHNYIPPQSNPAPMVPLPSPPSSESVTRSSSSESGGQYPSVSHLRQRLSKIKKRQSAQQEYGIGSSGKELFLPSRSVVSQTLATRSVSVGGVVREPREKSADDIHGRRRRTDIHDDVSLDESEKNLAEDQDAEDPDELDEILDRFKDCDDENGDIPHLSSGEQALERSHSFKAGKLPKVKHPSFTAESSKISAHDLDGLEDEGKTMSDETSRWSGSLYSRCSSIEDEDGSEERTDRFMRRVEAMLDAERNHSYIPPPRIPHPYALHSPTRRVNNASSNTPGRSWTKF